MSWLRSPIFYGAVLLSLGALLRIAISFPAPGGAMTVDDLRRTMDYQRAERPILKLEPRYQPYAFAFILSGSDAEVAALKRTIDAELAAADEVRARGLGGVPEYAAERLAAPDLALMGFGAALLFRGLAFVLAAGFGAGALHQMLAQAATLTRAPSEFYLAAILAALAWAALFWALRALSDGRLRLRS